MTTSSIYDTINILLTEYKKLDNNCKYLHVTLCSVCAALSVVLSLFYNYTYCPVSQHALF